ncbi:MAG: hypothetical protein K6T81_05035 [Alicyclobacillus macrosporangiidus]|uniref:hypothetical protein n=1 Tax=Alicyclobacillus macrosporangiidus TaxID=392015 RepID=UPI0026EFA549|nr:hypothetical protein [Alicyclobacillus macrosporangiidus]MCL6598086.1 hypothetical protein [Alicyclobacillus macrosporangiidus]
MRLDTLIKFGSLVFSVAQDERVQEMVKMAHKGAKRRGWLPSGAPIFPPSGPMVPPYAHATGPVLHRRPGAGR